MRSVVLCVAVGLAVPLLGSCAWATETEQPPSIGQVSVIATDTACELPVSTAPAGPTTFAVRNNGSLATEFYVYAADGTSVVAEAANIAPGSMGELAVALDAGDYITACKPGMTGDGIRGQFTATESGKEFATDPLAVAGSAAYVRWAQQQADELLTGTKEFAAAIKAGDVARAKELYPQVRLHWERIEPVAESFGDLDPVLDARVNDLEPGQEFTGWHRLERDLWKDGLQPDSPQIAAQMVSDTEDLVARIAVLELTADRITNGSKELLDEVATGKITGEEERYSHTDLWDFAANVQGSQRGYEELRPLIEARDPQLARQLDEQFAAMVALLDEYRRGDGFVPYTELSDKDVRVLSAQLEALSEPVSQLTAVVLP